MKSKIETIETARPQTGSEKAPQTPKNSPAHPWLLVFTVALFAGFGYVALTRACDILSILQVVTPNW